MIDCDLANEKERIQALYELDLLDTPADGSFDSITRLAASVFNVPISIISLVDTGRIWFKSHYGLSVQQVNCDPGLCASAILTDDVYVVEDARIDARTLANPLVASDFGLQFYAATPLRTKEHYNLGTFCIIDKQPRAFSAKEKVVLEQLGQLVMDEMQKRVRLRNTVYQIRNLAGDVEAELEYTIQRLQSHPHAVDETIAFLDTTRLFLANLKSQFAEI